MQRRIEWPKRSSANLHFPIIPLLCRPPPCDTAIASGKHGQFGGKDINVETSNAHMNHYPTNAPSLAWICSGLVALFAWRGPATASDAQNVASNVPASPEDLRHEFADLLRADPGNETLNLSYGLLCLDMERYSHAILAFERILFLNPSNERARIELARACFLLGQMEESRLQFERVLAGNPPPAVRRNVESYLKSIVDLRSKWRFTGRIESGVLYDDNVNYGPASETIDIAPISLGFAWVDQLQLSPESVQESAWGGFLAGTLLFAYQPQNNRSLSFNGYARMEGDAYDDASEYNFAAFQAGAGPRMQRGDHAVDLPLRMEYLVRGGDPLATVVGWAPGYFRQVSQCFGYSLSANLDYRDYEDSSDRNGWFGSLGAQIAYGLGSRTRLIGGVRALRDVPHADVWRNAGWEAFVGAATTPLDKLSCYANARFGASVYDERETLSPRDRRDEETTLAVGGSWLFSDRWGVNLTAQYTINHSTFDLYEYDRLSTKGSISYDY